MPAEPTLPEPTPEHEAIRARKHVLFREELAALLNSLSLENGSDTPDFILAEYLCDCLHSWDKAVAQRKRWYSGAGDLLPVGTFAKKD